MNHPPHFPLLMAHRGGLGPENSLQAIKSSTHCDIVELDIRKSQEGILYCYHGNLVEFLFPRLFFYQPFSKLKQKYPTLITLQEAAKAINDRILFLDIKDTTIAIEELQQVLPANVTSVYLACQNTNYLAALTTLPPHWKKICNGGFLRISGNLEKIRQLQLDAIEVFFWDYTKRKRRLLREQHLDVALARWFLPKKWYQQQCDTTESLWKWDEK